MHSHKFYFSNLQDDEQIVRIIHRHWFDILVQYLPFVGLLFLLIGGLVVLPYIEDEFSRGGVRVFWFMQSFLVLVVWLYGFMIWVDYYLDIWIVTTERVINVEQKGLFARQVSELRLSQVQDITTEVTGVISTFLNYGNVHVQTAAEETMFTFHKIANPYRVKARIMKLHKAAYKRMMMVDKNGGV